jgi:glutathione S-transferase
LWESRAVMMYLADHYGKDDSLYPKDPTKRFLVNQRLFFDMTLYQKFGDYYYPQIFQQKLEDPEKIEPFKNALGFLNTFLEGNEWACGDKMTLADLALAATIDTFDISAGVNLSGYPNIVRWYKKCQETIPGYEANRKGSEEFKSFFATAKKI